MPRARLPRPDHVLCACGSAIPVGERGPLPTRCDPCQDANRVGESARSITGGELSVTDAWKLARQLGAAAERLRKRHPR